MCESTLRRLLRLWPALCLALVAFGPHAAWAEKPITLDQLEAVVQSMQKAYEPVEDYVTVLHAQQRFDEELAPMEKMLLKFKKPFSVYMRWLDGDSKGREVIYIRGANDGNMWIHNGSFPDITLCLSPEACKDLSDGRHTVAEAGVAFVVDSMARDIALAKSRPLDKVSIWDYGEREVLGEPSRCYEMSTPPRKDSGYYGHRAYFCQSLRTGLLNKISVWDFRKLLVEDFTFADLKKNVGLTAKDFDPENPDYDF